MIRFGRNLLKHSIKPTIRTRPFLRPFSSSDSFLHGENSVYAEQMHQRWTENRSSVHASWDAYFTNLENGVDGQQAFQAAPVSRGGASQGTLQSQTRSSPQQTSQSSGIQTKQILLTKMIDSYRHSGHQRADIFPVKHESIKITFSNRFQTVEENPGQYGFTEAELDVAVPYLSPSEDFTTGKSHWTPREMSARLQEIYCGPIAFEYTHMQDPSIVEWFQKNVEEYPQIKYSVEEKKELFNRVCESQMFTDFCIKKFSSSKRFGIDGCDAAISGLEKLVDHSRQYGVQNVVIGMAHRGRLNTLACVFDKPYLELFTEFKDPGLEQTGQSIKKAVWGFSGDVKYHMGFSSHRKYEDGSKISIAMPPNPSHLEMVNPVVLGKTRAKLEQLHDPQGTKVTPVIIHGDAAIAGQGIVYETLQMEKLEGYSVGGTIHAVFNNNVGFTTDPKDSRSSRYCTDIAKATNRPIIHVNADYPEHVDWAFELAVDFRNQFHRDIYVDVIGYRVYGHNEQDMPKFTQPQVYQELEGKPSMYQLYTEQLIGEGVYTAEDIKQLEKKYFDIMDDAFVRANAGEFVPYDLKDSSSWGDDILKPSESSIDGGFDTSVSQKGLLAVNEAINQIPDSFQAHDIIKRIYKARHTSFKNGEGIDWAAAELMAYGTLISEGFGLRLSGEDVQRGTFSHRQVVIKDQTTGAPYNTLSPLLEDSEMNKLTVSNSLLSEYGVLGFEYGYSISQPNSLCIWEAQFGDFANVAQPVIDNMIAGGEVKWAQRCGLTMLLPHGYDGQGPEHSSARIERFLQMSDDNPHREDFDPVQTNHNEFVTNMSICNITMPGNYFHLLRRQLKRSFRKPLVVFTPKKLLRYKQARSTISEFTEGTKFLPVLVESALGDLVAPKEIKRLIFCSGQVYFDILNHRKENSVKDVAIIRIEEISPFPYKMIKEQLELYPNAQVIWAQEEQRNMGAWTYVKSKFNYFLRAQNRELIIYRGRGISGTTAVGSATTHKAELEVLVNWTFA